MHAGQEKDIHVKYNFLMSLLRGKKGHCFIVSLKFSVQAASPMITADNDYLSKHSALQVSILTFVKPH